MRLRDRAWANSAAIVALATVLFSVLRIYVWSRFYVPVALSVLAVADRPTILASTLLLVLVASAPFLWSEFVFSTRFTFRAIWDSKLPARDRIFSYLVLIGLSWTLLAIAPLYLLLTVEGLLILFVLGWLIVMVVTGARSGRVAVKDILRAKISADEKLRDWFITFILIFGAVTAVLSLPWTPLESITVKSPAQSLVGYVIGQQGPFTLFVNESKVATWIATNDITQRELCTNSDDMFSRPLAGLFSPVLLPLCPK